MAIDFLKEKSTFYYFYINKLRDKFWISYTLDKYENKNNK